MTTSANFFDLNSHVLSPVLVLFFVQSDLENLIRIRS
ncbi:hypothetical protein MESS2_1300007 [Mesorhizobium metallidurans STM 2683]|uniref:Uncharacterized protein n=1 Tax=Mesorhizobium metallidurans STM 2683 TaxID=1297569 RepID=M5EJD9_9HYPH|nr:hypothetical protein MESS2_1300007 [Mesorhizobium metallidurans STM 2683]